MSPASATVGASPVPGGVRGPTTRGLATVPTATRLMIFTVGLLTLWDFYLPAVGLRPFDIVALLLVTLAGVAAVAVREHSPLLWELAPARGPLVFAAAVLFVVAVGYVHDPADLRTGLGVIAGVVVFLALAGWRVDPVALGQGVDSLILLHAAAVVAQLAIWYGAGHLLNFHAVVGDSPRVFSVVFRPSGLFLEPASFSVSVFMLLVLRQRLGGGWTWRSWIGCLAMPLTLSVWGTFSALALALTRIGRSRFGWSLGLLLAAVVLPVVALVGPNVGNATGDLEVLRRLDDILSGQDSSQSHRYGPLLELGMRLGNEWRAWFGVGVSNEYHDFGLSGYAFVLQAAGLLGLCGVVGWLVVRAGRGARTWVTFGLLLALTASTQWTQWFWWAWLALVTRPGDPDSTARTTT